MNFNSALVAALPELRVFAIWLTKDRDQSDDLVQETACRALRFRESFVIGTNMEGWLKVIAKNLFYSERGKAARTVSMPDGFAETLPYLPDAIDRIELAEAAEAIQALPTTMREALMLVGFEGEKYGAAAIILGTEPGTVKSRVNRARLRLGPQFGRYTRSAQREVDRV